MSGASGRPSILGTVPSEQATVADVIAQALEIRALSDAAAGRATGVDRGVVASWRTGTRVPRGDKAREFLAKLGFGLRIELTVGDEPVSPLLVKDVTDLAAALADALQEMGWVRLAPLNDEGEGETRG